MLVTVIVDTVVMALGGSDISVTKLLSTNSMGQGSSVGIASRNVLDSSGIFRYRQDLPWGPPGLFPGG